MKNDKWQSVVPEGIRYFVKAWHLGYDKPFCIVQRRDNEKYYISPTDEESDDKDEGPIENLDAAKVIVRIRS